MVSPPKGDTLSNSPVREPVVRGQGRTPAERYLAQLADRSFLNLWSYPSPHRDQMVGADGKEICDLLVVCGDHILIFSEKTYKWPDADSEIAWSRWYRKAIAKSADQIRGAERWIAQFPDRIFLDPACKKPFPLEIPPVDRRKVHGIIVAGGAGRACKEYFRGGRGSLAINPGIVGDAHHDRDRTKVEPFWIGDVDPNGSFIHVLDDGSLDIIMRELDTITDFTDYLEKKANFIRSGRLAVAHGEEDLLAYYAIRINERGEHDFTHPDDRPWRDGESVAIDGSHYISHINDPRYLAKKRADKISYVWDRLIESFTKHMLDGTSLAPDWQGYDLKKSEKSVREMALEGRFERRSHGEAVAGALEIARNRDIFFRGMIPEAGSRRRPTGFFFLAVNLPPFELERGYDEYREFRAALTELYAKAILLRHEHLERVVGIATEPPRPSRGSSEDILYAERYPWTEEEKAEIRSACDKAGIMRPDYKEVKWGGQEFPEVVFPDPTPLPRTQFSGNRAQRRAAQAVARKRRD